MSDLPSKASTHCTSFEWCRSFMILISCRTFSFSFAVYAFINFPAQIFLVDFSTSLNTVPNLPLGHMKKKSHWDSVHKKMTRMHNCIIFIQSWSRNHSIETHDPSRSPTSYRSLTFTSVLMVTSLYSGCFSDSASKTIYLYGKVSFITIFKYIHWSAKNDLQSQYKIQFQIGYNQTQRSRCVQV